MEFEKNLKKVQLR